MVVVTARRTAAKRVFRAGHMRMDTQAMTCSTTDQRLSEGDLEAGDETSFASTSLDCVRCLSPRETLSGAWNERSLHRATGFVAGSGQWAVGSGQWAAGSGRLLEAADCGREGENENTQSSGVTSSQCDTTGLGLGRCRIDVSVNVISLPWVFFRLLCFVLLFLRPDLPRTSVSLPGCQS